MIKTFKKLIDREQKRINGEFIETYPKVFSSVVPGNISYEDWRSKSWATIERKSIIEILKENS